MFNAFDPRKDAAKDLPCGAEISTIAVVMNRKGAKIRPTKV